MISGQSYRRYTLRDKDATARAVAKLGTNTARVLFLAVESDMQYQSLLCLVSIAHYLDIMSVTDGSMVAYPGDVAEIWGVSEHRATVQLGILRKLGFVEGSAASGYKLAP